MAALAASNFEDLLANTALAAPACFRSSLFLGRHLGRYPSPALLAAAPHPGFPGEGKFMPPNPGAGGYQVLNDMFGRAHFAADRARQDIPVTRGTPRASHGSLLPARPVVAADVAMM